MSDFIVKMTWKMANQISKLASPFSKRNMKSSFYCSDGFFSFRFVYDELQIAGYGEPHRVRLGLSSSRSYGTKGRTIALKPKRYTGLHRICFALAFFTAFGALAGKVSHKILENFSKDLQVYSFNDDGVSGD